MSEETVNLGVLPTEIRSIIYSRLVNFSRKSKKFRDELQLTWFNFRLQRALSYRNDYQHLLQLLYDMDGISDLDENMRLYFHKRMVDVVQDTHSRHDRWIFTIYNFDEEKWEQFSESLLSPHYDFYLHGKIVDGNLTGILVLFQSIPFFYYLPFLYQLNFPSPLNDLVLSGWEDHINGLQGLDVSFGNRDAFEQVIESEEKLLPLCFPTEYSDLLLGKKQ
ncbi:MAG: hypothetical protein ABW098_20875 [Candidatus Thiodiazotropha sp.]